MSPGPGRWRLACPRRECPTKKKNIDQRISYNLNPLMPRDAPVSPVGIAELLRREPRADSFCSMSTAGQASPPKQSRNDLKWTHALMRAGFTCIPNIIFERQQALGLDALDINILLHIISFWWEVNNKPHPSKTTIANAIGVDPRTVQRRIAALESGGLIRREQRRESPTGSKTNIYHLDGLIAAATPYAHEKMQDIQVERAAKAARAKRKGPAKLIVVK